MKRILKLVAALVGLCMVVSVLGAIFNPTKPQSPTASTAPTAITLTRTPEAIETVAPATAVVPATAASPATPIPTSAPRGYVSRAIYGDKWPLVVEDGVLRCSPDGNGFNIVTFTAGQQTYALNGIAKAPKRMAQFGWLPIDDIRVPSKDTKGAWEYDPLPLVRMGLDLC